MKEFKPKGISSLMLVFTVTLSVMLTGCEQPVDSPSGDASAATITIAGVPVTLPGPHRDYWEAEEGTVSVDPAYAVGAEIVVTTVEDTASVKYAVVSKKSDNPSFVDTSTFDLQNNTFVYIEITSKGGNVLYYFTRVIFTNYNFTLSSVRLGNVLAVLAAPDPNYTEAESGYVILTETQLTNPLALTIIKDNEDQTIRFSKVSGNGTPDFTVTAPDPLEYTFASGDFLYIEVTEKNGYLKNIYKIVIIRSGLNTIGSLTIGGDTVTLATPNIVFTSAAKTSLAWADAKTSAEIVGAKVDPEATVQYSVSRTERTEAPVFTSMTEFSFDLGSNWLDIKVTPVYGVPNYYRYRINVGSSVNTLVNGSLKINGDLTPTGNLPTPNANPLATGLGTGTFNILTVSSLQNATVAATSTDSNATIRFTTTVALGETPVFRTPAPAGFNFPAGITYLYVEVTAQNGAANYYRWNVKVGEANNRLTSISIGTLTATPGTPNAGIPAAAAVPVTSSVALTNVTVSAIPESSKTTVRYAVTEATNTVPIFDNTTAFTFPIGSRFLIVEVTQENRDVFYYKFQVLAGDSDNTLSGNVSIGSLTASPGTPNTTATSAQAVLIRPAAGLTNVMVSTAPASANAVVAYAITTASTTAPAFGSANSFTFGTGSTWLYVRVTAQNGAVNYYRFQVAIGNDEASLTGVTVAGVAATLGTPGPSANIVAANRGSVTVSAWAGAKAIAVSGALSGAVVAWGVTTNASTTGPTSFTTNNVTFSASNTNLVIRVTSESGATVSYYRIVAHL